MTMLYNPIKHGEFATPQEFFDELNKEFQFTLDPCATDENAKCDKYFTKETDGLSQKWTGRVFCNPPYNEISKWVEKAYQECLVIGNCELVVLLIPSRTDTRWFHNFCYGRSEIRFIKGRLKFGGLKESAPFPSMLVIFRNNIQPKVERLNDSFINK